MDSNSLSARLQLPQVANYVVAGIAASLPWSTSAASILIALWIIAVLPTVTPATVWREVKTWPGGLPVVLFLLGVAGMAWADVPFRDRLGGIESFLRLLFVPLLFAQYRGSSRGRCALWAFLVSCTLLLVASYAVAIWPQLTPGRDYGIPVRNHITQSAEFTICILALACLAYEAWKVDKHVHVAAAAVLAVAFLFDLFFIRASRTTLVVLPLVALALAGRLFGWRGAVLAVLGGAVLAGLLWASSPFLRWRVQATIDEIQVYRTSSTVTSTGERLEFLRKSLGFVRDAPLLGHGTGSIKSEFARASEGKAGVAAEISSNPHNQTLAIAIQLGLIGAAVLWAMWLAHLLLFRGGGVYGTLGLVVVLQHILGSLFNSYLFDFSEGWLYIFAVGVLGGMVTQKAEKPL